MEKHVISNFHEVHYPTYLHHILSWQSRDNGGLSNPLIAGINTQLTKIVFAPTPNISLIRKRKCVIAAGCYVHNEGIFQ